MKTKSVVICVSLLVAAGAVAVYLYAYASTNQCLYGLYVVQEIEDPEDLTKVFLVVGVYHKQPSCDCVHSLGNGPVVYYSTESCGGAGGSQGMSWAKTVECNGGYADEYRTSLHLETDTTYYLYARSCTNIVNANCRSPQSGCITYLTGE